MTAGHPWRTSTATGSFAGGALADRCGPRQILIIGLTLLAAGSPVAVFCTDYGFIRGGTPSGFSSPITPVSIAASLTGALLVIGCLRSQESALETTHGHRPASLTDTAHRG